MTKRRVVIPQDLDNLAVANAQFKVCYDALAEGRDRMAAGYEMPEEEQSRVFGAFMAAAINLFTQSNTVVKLAKEQDLDEPKPGKTLFVPGPQVLELP